jgi:protoporphyrinogen oxidase
MSVPPILPQVVDCVIIGAGPAGLTAAYRLLQAGKSVVVLEAHPHLVGGISRTENYKGYRFDIGGHRFFSRAPEVNEFWHEVLPEGFEQRQRLSRIYYDGKFYHYPLRALEALTNLGLWRSLLCVASYIKWQFSPIPTPRNLREWVSNQFGARLFEIFFRTYTEKVWGLRCEQISADWAAQRIKSLNLAKAVLQSLGWGSRAREAPTSLIDRFHYPRLGPGMMWEAVRGKVIAMGGHIVMGATVDKLMYTNTGWQVSWGTQGLYVHAAHVISSAPLREIMAVLEPPAQTRQQAAQLKYRDFITVALILDRPVSFKDNWIYIHDPAVRVGRIQNFGAWSPAMVPNAQTSCLGLEYFCFEGDGLWSLPDADILALATRELLQLGLCGEAKVIDGAVVRQPKAYPVYDDGYKQTLQIIRAELDGRYPGLHMVGRNGMHRYNNQDHSMLTALRTVQNILAGQMLSDVWAVNADDNYNESGSSGLRAVPEPLKKS